MKLDLSIPRRWPFITIGFLLVAFYVFWFIAELLVVPE